MGKFILSSSQIISKLQDHKFSLVYEYLFQGSQVEFPKVRIWVEGLLPEIWLIS